MVVCLRFALIGLGILSIARADQPQPETLAAFEHYATLVETELKTRTGPHSFLWLDQHQKEKSLAWFSQDVIAPLKMLDNGEEVPVPGGSMQHWIGAVFLEGATLDRVRDVIIGFADYKTRFKDQISGSRQVKRDGDHFDAFLRIYKRQLQTVALNVNLSADYTLLQPNRAYLICRSTHIGEALHPKDKDSYEERSTDEAYGYLWRMNLYWRLQYSDNGVYAELESISLSREAGGRRLARLLNGFIENFPREFTAGFMDGLRQAFPIAH